MNHTTDLSRSPFLNRVRLIVVVTLFAVTGTSGPAAADTVVLDNGRTLDGRAVVLQNGDVELHSSMGMIRIPKQDVAEVRTTETVESKVRAELERLVDPSADDFYELGFMADRAGAATLAARLYHEALRLDQDHESARLQLGFRKSPRGWVSDSGVLAVASDTAPTSSPRSATSPPGSPSAVAAAAEQRERLALLRTLRAQATAALRAEQQRQLLYAAQEAQLERATQPAVRSDLRPLYPSYYGAVYTPLYRTGPAIESPPRRRPDLGRAIHQPRRPQAPAQQVAPGSDRRRTLVRIPG